VTSLFLLVKISWRNLWRNPRGTLLTALALGLGLALLLISLGLLDGGHEQTIADGVRFGPGHVVVQAKGYQDSGSCRRRSSPTSKDFYKRPLSSILCGELAPGFWPPVFLVLPPVLRALELSV
jgi:hypothetical protein